MLHTLGRKKGKGERKRRSQKILDCSVLTRRISPDGFATKTNGQLGTRRGMGLCPCGLLLKKKVHENSNLWRNRGGRKEQQLHWDWETVRDAGGLLEALRSRLPE